MQILEYAEVDSTTRRLRIRVEAGTLTENYEAVLTELAGESDVPGFRRGKAPRHLLERHIGKKNLWEKARDKASDKALEEALKEKGIKSRRKAAFEHAEYAGEGDYEFTATVEISQEE